MTTRTPRSRMRPIRPSGRGAASAPTRRTPDAAAPTPAGRRPGRRVLLAGCGVALMLGGALAVLLTLPSMERVDAPQVTRDATPRLELRVAHPLAMTASDVHVLVDGDAVDRRRIELDADGRISIRVPRMDDGRHEVVVRANDAGLLRQTLRQKWSFTVDTRPPTARITAPLAPPAGSNAYVQPRTALVTRLPLRLKLAVEPGSRVEVRSNAAAAGEVRAKASQATQRTLQVPLPEGAQTLLVEVTDAAGNVTQRRQRVLVDTQGPSVRAAVPSVSRSATLDLDVRAADPLGASLEVLVDGNVVEDAVELVSSTPAPHGVAATDAGGDASHPAPIVAAWRISLPEPLYEGRHRLELVAVDSAGTRTRIRRATIVDSTERLGDVVGLRGGARGADVLELQQALIEQEAATRAQLASELRARTYGPATREAVTAFQRAKGMSVDGVAGSDTIARLTLRIVIDRSTRMLTLYRRGEVVKSYPIAVGSPEYPTPAGSFEIQSMQKHPTWTPPDSEWAKDAKVTPPGPDNPLGTRWMAINGTVGIHGTNNAASIGYSVSHGCIRMRIPDVEELFDMVSLGTRVDVV